MRLIYGPLREGVGALYKSVSFSSFGWRCFCSSCSISVNSIYPVQVKTLTDCFERITNVLTTEIAIGCLELRLRIGTSRDLRELRRLVEGGILVETIKRALQTKELAEKAAKYGLKWRQVRLKVSIRKDDLNRCETFLKVKEGEGFLSEQVFEPSFHLLLYFSSCSSTKLQLLIGDH